MVLCCDVVCCVWQSMGFNGMVECRPVVQVAFAYNTLRANALGVDVPTRRLRVFTRRLDVARSFTQLYASVHMPVLITQLTHKLIHASLEQGLGEARLLAKDWLVNFTVQHIPSFCLLFVCNVLCADEIWCGLGWFGSGVLQPTHFG